jgi:voltage-gated potassium channel
VKHSQFISFLRKQFGKRPVATLIFSLIAIYLCVVIIVMVCEEESFTKASGMIMPAFLGELGTVESRSLLTQVSIIVALIVSIAFLAAITGKITSMFVEFCRVGGSIVKKVDLSEHIIICGWNFQGDKIVDELLRSEVKPRRKIVVLANREIRPVKDERVEFVKGDPTQDEALVRAGIKSANSAIVLSDLTKPANEADSEALMIILAVESLNRKIHSCVQIVNSSNKIHFKRAHADEIICLDQIGGNLVVASALNHGMSQVVSELLTFDSGSEFYRYEGPLSENLVGREFSQAVQVLAEKRILLLGIETDGSEELQQRLSSDILRSSDSDNRVVLVNPQNQYNIRQGDVLFLIAESAPGKL